MQARHAAAFEAKDAKDLRGAPAWDHQARWKDRDVSSGSSVMSVGFIGLGTMGAPMARNVLKKGHALAVYDVAAGGRRDARRRGRAAPPRRRRPSRAASDVVITMLPDAPDVERVALGAHGIVEGIRAGAVYVDMSTIDPATTTQGRRGDSRRRARRWSTVPVGKTADAAVAGTLTLMVGGDAADIARVRPVLDCMGTDFFHCGELGAGQTIKLINNLLATCIAEASVEALVTGAKAGLSLDTMIGGVQDDDGVEQPARGRDAEAAAGRRLQPGLHDEARAQGLPARADDGGRARRRGAGGTRRAREPGAGFGARARQRRRRRAAQAARGARRRPGEVAAGVNGASRTWDAIVIHADDDVAVALRDLAAGSCARLRVGATTRELVVREAIPLGHKVALHGIAAGAVVRKYGEPIGAATTAIDVGSHVHVHNLASRRARRTP